MLVAAMLCALSLGLAACGGGASSAASSAESTSEQGASSVEADAYTTGASTQEDEDAIAKAMQENIDSFKEGLNESTSLFKSDPEFSEVTTLLEEIGVDVDEFLEACFGKSGIEMGEIKVDGDTATVELTIVAPDYNKLGSAMESASEKIEALNTADMTVEEVKSVVNETIISTMNEELPTTSSPFTVQYGKVNDEWRIQNMGELSQAIKTVYGTKAE